jgi:endonuclease-3 related protein
MKQFDREKNKVEIFNEYHGLIVKHGKEFCKTVPLCEGCFLKDLCHYH